MNQRDQRLGMHTSIHRRDFIAGTGIAIGATVMPWSNNANAIGAQDTAGYYPPSLTGMRGSHAGSFEVAHALRDGHKFPASHSGETYDLVVAGGGISGLSAAYFYRQAMGNDARILILDNHDDFGGHAKRNEFSLDGRTIIGYGGTMLMSSPESYPANASRLIDELGIDLSRFEAAHDQNLYSSLGLRSATFFDQETFGADHLAVGRLSEMDVLIKTPLSDQGRADLHRLYENKQHYLQDLSDAEKLEYLTHTDYASYLKDRAGIGDEALKVIVSRPRGTWGITSDALPARTAWSSGYPGFANLELQETTGSSINRPYAHHFPDGNASIARLLVRRLIPGAAAGQSMEDIITTRFDYARLDRPDSNTRLRLNSTVVQVKHQDGNPARPVEITYVRDGKASTITGGQVVMACYHSIIPGLCPELPAPQKEVLSTSLRSPLVYTNVLLKNWSSFANLGIRRVSCPGSFHSGVTLDFPISMGDYQFSANPQEPMVLHLTQVPGKPGSSARQQFIAGRRTLLETSFETFERNTRDQLDRILGPGGFDPARDIAGITVNRWPHGYTFAYQPSTDRVVFEPGQWPPEEQFWKQASQRFGNISIAASDAASNAMTEAAIEEAWRAVNDLQR